MSESPITGSPASSPATGASTHLNGEVVRAAEITRNGHAETGVQFLLVRSGGTDYDQQRRIKGRIDIPLSEEGVDQVSETAKATADVALEAVYAAPCQASMQTAQKLAEPCGAKVKSSPELQNLDHGLWEGKLIDDIKAQQPKVYRRWQENPETVCPPEGEMLDAARHRLQEVVEKALKKHKAGVIAFVIPEPLATVFSCHIQGKQLGDLWQTEKNSGKWELMTYRELVEGSNVDDQHDEAQ